MVIALKPDLSKDRMDMKFLPSTTPSEERLPAQPYYNLALAQNERLSRKSVTENF